MSVHPLDAGRAVDPWAGDDPDGLHLEALEVAQHEEEMDDYEVTQHQDGRTTVIIGTRDGRQVGWMIARNPVKNEQ